MPSSSATGGEEKCPVDHESRQAWLQAAAQKTPPPSASPPNATPYISPTRPVRYSLDAGRWEADPTSPRRPPTHPSSSSSSTSAAARSLSTDRVISSIPRALPTNHDREPHAAERAAMRPAAGETVPANMEADTGHDRDTGNWIYPSQEMFFNAMRRKGHEAQAVDMATVVPIHNAVNERAWAEIKAWEAGRGSEACGGPRLVSFAGDSKALTPRARWKSWMGYSKPFDRHDWVVDRCGKRIEYVIDFYAGKNEGVPGKNLNFYLDVRPKLNSWEGIKLRSSRTVGL